MEVGRNAHSGVDTSLGSRPRILRREQNTSLDNVTSLLDATRGDILPPRDGTPVMNKSIQNLSIGEAVMASPSPHESRRARQVVPANTSSTDMTHIRDHYMECIKLSTENKINSKNAFLLKLNSLTSTEALTTEGETDFKMAGMAVDASAKIYAGRVDSVHYDTFSVLGSLGARRGSKGAEEEAEAGERESKKTQKSQKKRKLRSKLEKPENLNYKNLELEYYDDPILKKIAAASDENGVGGLLALQLPMEERFFQLKLDMSEPYPLRYKSVWSEGDYVAGTTGVKELFEMFDSIEERPAPTCPLVEGYLFDEEGNFVRRGGLLGDEAATYETDLGSLERMSPETLTSPPNPQLDLDGLEDSFHSPDNTSVEEECAPLAPSSPVLSPMSSIARVLDLIEPSEFAYLGADTLRELRRKEERMGGSSIRLAQQSRASRKGGRESKKPLKLIDFSSQIPPSALVLPKSAASLQNADSSVEAKAGQKNFFRNGDLSPPFDSKSLSTLFLLPSAAVAVQKQTCDPQPGGDGEHSYNYDAETDVSAYVPFIPPVERDTESNPDSSPAPSANLSLIAAPPRPERILLSYDKRPRQVDMKGLKSRMWRLIEATSGEVAPEASSSCVQFSLLTEQLSPAPGEDAGEKEFTSKAILFSTLLHLANEHTLVLEQPDHSADINIYQSTHIAE